jgi:hypothetical protein
MFQDMHDRINRLLDRIESRIALWTVLGGGSAVGLITGWLSSGVDLINQFGWFGWWVAALCGAFIAALIVLALVWVRYAWVYATTRRKWQEQVDTFNPLDRDFRAMRMRAHDLMHPITKTISGKRLYDCELIGPVNLFFYRDLLFNGVSFSDCNVVALWPDETGSLFPGNSTIVEKTEMHGGSIFGATIMIPPQMVAEMKAMGAVFSTLTGDPEIDARWRPETG